MVLEILKTELILLRIDLLSAVESFFSKKKSLGYEGVILFKKYAFLYLILF